MFRMFAISAMAFFSSSVFAVDPFNLPWVNHSTEQRDTYSSGDMPNGIFVVEAYFQSCTYCNSNAPRVQKLAADYKEHTRVQVLDVGRDQTDRDYQIWINRHHPNHPVLRDSQMKLLGQLHVGGYPTTVILDCHLKEVFRSEGDWAPATERQIRSHINQLLEKDCSAE